MNIESKIKALIIERYGNVSNFCKKINMANSTFATIMKNGIHNANISSVIKICKELDISADELGNDRIVPKSSNGETKELSQIVNLSVMNLPNANITLDGIQLSSDERSLFADALELSLELLRRRRT